MLFRREISRFGNAGDGDRKSLYDALITTPRYDDKEYTLVLLALKLTLVTFQLT